MPGRNGESPIPYDGASGFKFSHRLFQSKDDFERIDDQFKTEKDGSGQSMHEIARRYWDDPEYRERLRRQIAEGRGKRKR